MVRVRYSFGSRHTGRIANIKKQRVKYPAVMKEVIAISDIVLEVLDARFIEETRNIDIEEKIDSLGKKLIFVFNKCDLLAEGEKEKGEGGKDEIDKAIKEFEKQIPSWMRPYVFVSATRGIGLNDLKGRIKMEAKRILLERKNSLVDSQELLVSSIERKKRGEERKKLRGALKAVASKGEENWKRIHVGVIGVPNAGKSSVINFVTRRSAAGTGAKAGFTKGMQKIRLGEGILILDTPGVIPESRYTTQKDRGMLRDAKVGARSYSDVRDPERVIMFLINAREPEDPDNLTEEDEARILEAKNNSVAIDKFYGVSGEGDVEVLIQELGRKKGFLGKGGRVDEDRTARLILRDWQEGKIRV